MSIRPCITLQEAFAAMDTHQVSSGFYTLPLADSLNDAMGMTMAIITDRILARGWEPEGYEQCNGFRIYRYKTTG